MLRNWFIISIRRFQRDIVNALINVFGLTLGLVVFMLIFIYVNHEFSFDNFHTNANRIYRLTREDNTNPYLGSGKYAVMPAPLYDVMADMAGVDQVTRMGRWGQVVIESGDETFYEDQYFAADYGLVEMLSFKSVAGNVQDALKNPRTAVISAQTAIKLFGTTDAVGKTIKLTSYVNLGEYTVEAVFLEFPSHSTAQFNIILRFIDVVTSTQAGDLQNWGNSNYNYMVMLHPGTDPKTLEAQLDEHLHKKYLGTEQEESAKATHYTHLLSVSELLKFSG